MKSRTVLVCIVALGSFTLSASAEQLTQDYSFDRPALTRISIAGQAYDRVIMPGCPNGGTVGTPALPAQGARILLPAGADISSVTIVPGDPVALGTAYYIEPVGSPVRLSAGPGEAGPPVPDKAIYASNDPFPGAQFEQIGVHAFRGYAILTLKLQPVQYVPATGELFYYPRLTVVIDTVDGGRHSTLFRALAEDDAEIRCRVDNPKVADSYATTEGRDARSFELLIITTDALAGAFVPLKNFHDSRGMPTEIRTTGTDIGSSDPVAVRAYITERYLSDGISYVIIGGDDDGVPAMNLYVDGTSDMPGDLFFGCLDGSWNYDGDSYYGEPTDGEGGGDVDLVAEVYVGRAAADNATEVGRFVDKTIWYVTNQHSQPEKAILVGEYLGFGGVAEYGGNYLDELVDGSTAHGYTTVGIPSEDFVIDKLYDRDWMGGDWPQTQIEARINAGQHFVNHLGHGSPDYAMKLYNSDVLNDLTNDDLCFVYSQTCSAGHFDGTDCWAETANIKTDHGAFAVIMNAREGYGEWESTDGPSQRFDREFWDAVFNPAEDMPELGRANQDSKEDNLYRINEPQMRWCYYELNLFGDPTVALKGTCADAGTVTLDRAKYACEAAAAVLVNDCGLNADDQAIDYVTVDIDSDSETGVEQITLAETDPSSAKFEGTITLSVTDVPGALLVAEGDAVIVTYIDADDGEGGTGIMVTDAATVDCTPPIIYFVYTSDVQPRSATVTFSTDEPTNGTAHYGQSCAFLTETATGSGYSEAPTVGLSGLTDDTTYFYIVEAEDEAGNTTTDDNEGACYTFTTPEVPDFFTEQFDGDNDLDNLTLTFTPNGSVDFYTGCVEPIDALPTDPEGGTALIIPEDSYEQVSPSSAVSLYGVDYSYFFVCDNGYITFAAGDTDYTETLEDHFDAPRISPLFDDFSVDNGGTVSWKELADRVVVTYEGVPEYGTTNSNTYQVEMYFDGTIVISYLDLAATDGIAGLSAGNGLDPDFYESELSAMGACAAFTIELPDGTPWRVDPELATAIPVQIDNGGETVVPGSPTLHYRYDEGAFLTSPLNPLGGNMFEALLPATDCGLTLEYYVSASGDGGTTLYCPFDAPAGCFSTLAATLTMVLDDDFEIDNGWTVENDPSLMTGAWERGIPVGDLTTGAPVNDYDGSGHCYLTENLAGSSDVDGGPTQLISPTLDFSNSTAPVIRYARWFVCDDDLPPAQDYLEVEVSDDGGASWTLVESYTDTEDGWAVNTIQVADYVDLTAQFNIRFSVEDNPNNSKVEAGIDAVEIYDLSCAAAGACDFDEDGDVDLNDFATFATCYGFPVSAPAPECSPADAAACDVTGDGFIELNDFATFALEYTG